MSELVYVAAVGTDGMRPVVWGMGSASTFDNAAAEAMNDATHQLREAGVESELEAVQIDAARAERINGGDVDAEDLWLQKR